MLLTRQAATRGGGGSGGSAPVNTVAPAITGTATVGETLTATTGTWTNSPASYAYVWKRAGTVIPMETTNTCMVPPNAATETITVEVTATNGSGSSTAAASSATAAIARAYLASSFASATGIWSHCMGIQSGYSGSLVDIDMDGVTKTCAMDSKGLLDRADIEAWWALRTSYTGLGGVMPRVSKIYCQGTTTTAHLVQATDQYRPILDMNNWRSDGTIPLAFNGYNGRSSMWDGSDPQTTSIPVPVAEQLSYMQVAPSTLTFRTGEHTVALVVEGVSSIGTNSPQQYLAGMKALTNSAVNNWGLRSGSLNWAGPYGLGVTSGSTPATMFENPASVLRMPTTRCLIAEMQSVTATNTIDGFTPASNAVVNIRVNNDTAQEWTANTAVARTASNGASGFFALGRGPTAAAGTPDGTAFAFYSMVYFNDPLSTGSAPVVDNRSASYASAMKCMNVRNDDTTVVTVFGASSAVGYAGSAGLGFASRIGPLFGPKVRTQTYAMSNGRISTHMYPNATALAAQAVSGKRNIAILYAVSPDIGQSPYYTGVQAFDYARLFAQALIASGNWYSVYIATFISSKFGATLNPIGPAGCVAEVAAFNAEVMTPANMTSYGYTGIDIVNTLTATERDVSNYHYHDTSGHARAEITQGLMATIFANAISADVI